MTRKSTTETLVAAMRILARDIDGDGVANAAIAEAADRLEEQQARIAELEARADHFRDATKMITDRQLAGAVNELRDIAIKFHAAGQLRERIAGVVCGLMRGDPARADTVAVNREALEALRKSLEPLVRMNCEVVEPAAVFSAIKAARHLLNGGAK